MVAVIQSVQLVAAKVAVVNKVVTAIRPHIKAARAFMAKDCNEFLAQVFIEKYSSVKVGSNLSKTEDGKQSPGRSGLRTFRIFGKF
jgi:hypothetical protein